MRTAFEKKHNQSIKTANSTPYFISTNIYPKLNIEKSISRYEHDSDALSNRAMAILQQKPMIQKSKSKEEEEPVQARFEKVQLQEEQKKQSKSLETDLVSQNNTTRSTSPDKHIQRTNGTKTLDCSCKRVKKVDVSKLIKKPNGKIQFDVGGEGDYPHANNINIQRCRMGGKQLIPNLICASGANIPVPVGTANELYNENAPTFPKEFARVTASKAFFSLFHPKEYALDMNIHKKVVEATGLKYRSSMTHRVKLRGYSGIQTQFKRP